MENDLRDHGALLGAIKGIKSELRLITDIMQRGFDEMNGKMTRSHEERRQAEDRLWLAYNHHTGRQPTSDHSVMEDRLATTNRRIDENERRHQRLDTVVKTVIAVFSAITGTLLLWGRALRNLMFGPPG